MSKSHVFKNTHIHGEVMVKANTDAICRLDAPTVASDVNAYFEANAPQYYIAINAWLLLCDDVTGNTRLSQELADVIRTRGLLRTIKSCDALAGNVIAMMAGQETDPIPNEDAFLGYLISGIDNYSYLLMVLRFLKRFTITRADKLLDDALESVLNINRYASVPECKYLEELIAKHLKRMFANFSKFYEEDAVAFSSGVCAGARTLTEKLRDYSRFEKGWRSPLYPIGDYINGCEAWPHIIDDPFDWDEEPFYVVTLQAVPKSYKTYRIIAPERAYEAAHMQAVRVALEKSLASTTYGWFFDPHCQDTNRELARLASLNAKMATLDLSSASDSIAYNLAQRVFPSDVFQAIDKYRATWLKVKKRDGFILTNSKIFLTSGNPCTFICEGALFLAIYMACGDIYRLHTGTAPLSPFIFGDDGICDSRIYSLVYDALTRLGFTVNSSKSYATGRFRESCGVEYWAGLPVHHDYWPRKEIRVDRPEGIGELCALQHRVFNFFSVEKFLTRVVEALVPDMTSSYPGSDCFDLWSRTPRFGKRRAPVAKAAGPLGKTLSPDFPAELLLREAHYVLKEKPCNAPDVGTQAWVNYQSYQYAKFLAEGPLYADPLDELLGVSTRRANQSSEQKPALELRKVII